VLAGAPGAWFLHAPCHMHACALLRQQQYLNDKLTGGGGVFWNGCVHVVCMYAMACVLACRPLLHSVCWLVCLVPACCLHVCKVRWHFKRVHAPVCGWVCAVATCTLATKPSSHAGCCFMTCACPFMCCCGLWLLPCLSACGCLLQLQEHTSQLDHLAGPQVSVTPLPALAGPQCAQVLDQRGSCQRVPASPRNSRLY
jgi:hypothetical protein